MSKATGSPTGVDDELTNLETDIIFPGTLPAELRIVLKEKIQLILTKMYVDIEHFVTAMGFIAEACHPPVTTLERREMIDTALAMIRQYIALFENHKAMARLHVFHVHGVPLPD
ncbi:hypothetical protein L2E82_44948 [Cichorium intybus]|uniref:Uncharacterized protein n=1 Tax=Cichorium intybus TaxID=13427 RepID=A0ACB8ZR79_CICIN|nr:hypothetical protein L2E82_44948 [Cichorium intybus]